MKIASIKTIMKSRNTRRTYAYRALERESMDSPSDNIDQILGEFMKGEMSREEEINWAIREREFRMINA